VKLTRFTERLNFEKELKSTVWGREFQQLITRSLPTRSDRSLAAIFLILTCEPNDISSVFDGFSWRRLEAHQSPTQCHDDISNGSRVIVLTNTQTHANGRH